MSKLPPRLPSTSSSLTLTGESIRRRISSSHRQMDPAFRSIAEEVETVVLCPAQHQERPSSPPPPLHALGGNENKAKDPAYRAVQRGIDPPSSDPYPRTNSLCSTLTSASQIPRLPTPDFSQADLSQLNYWSLSLPGLPYRTEDHRQTLESCDPSTLPVESADPATESNSQDVTFTKCEAEMPERESAQSGSNTSGKPPLLPSLSTTSKLTRKWPAPQTVKRRMRSRQPPLGLAALELAEGLGVDRPERWTKHKWCLLFSVCTVYAYGGAGLVCAILTWFRAWDLADVMYVADYDVLILVTLASSILLFTALLGTTGTFLNSRPILAIYALLLWPALISIAAIGYTSYKRSAFALDRKLNLAWSQWYTPQGRLMIQDALGCCGFYSALHGATPSARCYSRTPLPGCKGALYRFEARNLARTWGAVFSLVPLHLVNIMVALLCANHVNERFGKGIMPKKYRLNRTDLARTEEMALKMKVVRPELSRAGSSGVLREDRESERLTDDKI